MEIPMSSPDVTEVEIEAVRKVLNTPHLSLGPCLEKFESQFSEYLKASYSTGVSSGTSALHLCMIAAGIQEGSLVITTPFSFVASANIVLYERGIPIFVDVDEKTGNINPELVADAVETLCHNRSTSRLPRNLCDTNYPIKRPLGIIAVHAFGQPADMDKLTGIAREYGLVVIEDACEGLGSEYKQRKAGTLGDAAAFAFYPNKQITTGEGGMIVTQKEEWHSLFRSLRNQGRDVFNTWLKHDRLGYNYRLDEMSAALGLAQLQRIEEILVKRERVANWYNKRLKNLEGVQIPFIAPTTTSVSWFVYVIRLSSRINRGKLITALNEKGVPTRTYFMPIHLQPFYQKKFGYRRGDFPIAEKLGDVSLALPFSGVMIESQVDYVCDSLESILKTYQ